MTNTDKHIIWIVEDDLDDRILLNEAFKETKIPCSLFLFTDAISALQKLGTCSVNDLPEILVTDYNMHIMNGAELIEAMGAHKRYDAILKIILSTSSYLFDTEECIKRGADAYFVKPSGYVGLIEVAFSILALKK